MRNLPYRLMMIIWMAFFTTHVSNAQNYTFARLQGTPVNTTGWTLYGSAYAGNIVNNNNSEIVVCPSEQVTAGAIFYNEPVSLSVCKKWSAEFDFRMFDGDGADGMAFCFLDAPPSDFVEGGGLGIPANGNGLKVSFDLYPGCETDDVDASPKITIRWGVGYDECAAQPTATNTMGSLSFIRSAIYQHAKIDYNDGNISVSINNTIYLTGFQRFEFPGYVGFSAGTGELTDNHSIKNVVIYTEKPVADAGADIALCSGETGQLGAANNAEYLYSWSPATGLSVTDISNPSVTLNNNGTGPLLQKYYVNTSFSATPGCTATDSMIVTVNGVPAITTPAAARAVCFSNTTQSSSLNYTDATNLPTKYSITWNAASLAAGLVNLVDASISASSLAIPVAAGVASGTYTGTVTVSSEAGCVGNSNTFSLTIDSPATGSLASLLLCSGASGELTIADYNGNITGWQSSLNGTDWSAINNITTTQSYDNITQPTRYRVVLDGGGCGIGYSTIAQLNVHNLWTGSTSANWGDPSNWSGNVLPSTSCPQVIIPAGTAFSPVLSSGTATIDSLIILPSASLTVDNATLQLAGSITNNGSFNTTNGTLEFNGAATQNISGNMFVSNMVKGIVVSNSNGVVIAGGNGNELNVTDSLSFGNVDGANLTTNDNLVLLSTATNTARISDLTNNGINNGNKFTGNVTVQRFYPATRAWRLVTSPLSGTGSIYQTWQNNGVYEAGKGTLVTGREVTPDNGIDPSAQMNSSLKTGSALTEVGNTKAMNLSGSTGTADNTGYFIFVRGDRDPANTSVSNSNETTLSSTGKLQTGTQVFSASPVVRAFTLVGNPYASPVDFNKLIRENLYKRFYVWDPRLNRVGGYVVLEDLDNNGSYVITPEDGPGGQNNIIQSSQAFFVQTELDGAASLTFEETSKSAENNQGMFRPLIKNKTLRINLFNFKDDSSKSLADGALAIFDSRYSNDVILEDAPKLNNLNESLGLLRNDRVLSVERRPAIRVGDTLWLRLTRTTPRKYNFEIKTGELGTDNIAGFILDRFLKRLTAVNMDGVTVVDFDVTTDPASAEKDRFCIIFKPAIVYTKVEAKIANHDVAIEWQVANENGIQGYTIERSLDSLTFVSLATKPPVSNNGSGDVLYNWPDIAPAPGIYYYRIRSLSNNNVTAYSNTVKVKINKASPSIYVLPNPVTNNVIYLQMNDVQSGVYAVRLINNLGQPVRKNVINHTAGSTTENIRTGKKLVAGMYQLEVIAPDKKVTTMKVIVE